MTKKVEQFSMFRTFLIVMTPIVVESIKNGANTSGNLAWYGISSALLFGRNLLYAAVIFLILAMYYQTNGLFFYTFTVVGVLCALLGANLFRQYLHYVYYMLNTSK